MQEGASIEDVFLGCLPALPDAAQSFVNLSKAPNLPKTSYANLLLSDPVLSTRIFSFINTVLNPSNSGYLSINKGISIMGLHKFKNLVIVFALFSVFQDADCTELYKYSLLCAHYADAIAAQFGFINPNDAFLLGFMHDVGKIAMRIKYGEKYLTAPDINGEYANEFSQEEERENFLYSHSEVSGYICKTWNLPAVICDAIQNHHSPLSAKLPEASSIIYLSDMLAGQNSKLNTRTQEVLEYMRLSKSDLAPHTDGMHRKLHPYFEILGIS